MGLFSSLPPWAEALIGVAAAAGIGATGGALAGPALAGLGAGAGAAGGAAAGAGAGAAAGAGAGAAGAAGAGAGLGAAGATGLTLTGEAAALAPALATTGYSLSAAPAMAGAMEAVPVALAPAGYSLGVSAPFTGAIGGSALGAGTPTLTPQLAGWAAKETLPQAGMSFSDWMAQNATLDNAYKSAVTGGTVLSAGRALMPTHPEPPAPRFQNARGGAGYTPVATRMLDVLAQQLASRGASGIYRRR